MNVKSQYDLDIGGREKKDLQDYLNNLDKKKHEKLITSYRVGDKLSNQLRITPLQFESYGTF